MKKALTVLMAFSTVAIMAACSVIDTGNGGSGNSNDNKPAANEETKPEEEGNKIWDMSVLPTDFADVPEGVKPEKLTVYEEYEDTYTGYKGTLFKLDFRADDEQLDTFNENMKTNGWLGGMTMPDDESEFIAGKWTNDKWYATIARGYADDSEKDGLKYTIKMEIYRCARVFPEDILSYFPEFNKFTVVTNDYVGYDEDEEKYYYEYKGKLDDFWCWYFTGSGAFVGVTDEDVEEYLKALEKENFTIYRYPDGGGDTMKVEAEKVINSGRETVTVYMELNRELNTMEATYTNNMEYFKQK